MEKDSNPVNSNNYDEEMHNAKIESLKEGTKKLINEAEENYNKLNNITFIFSIIIEKSKKYTEDYDRKFKKLNQILDSLQVPINEESLLDVQKEFDKYRTEYKGKEAHEIMNCLEQIIKMLEGNPDLKAILENLERWGLNLNDNRNIVDINSNGIRDSNYISNNSDINILSNYSDINRNPNIHNRERSNIHNNIPNPNNNRNNLRDSSNNFEDNEDEDSIEDDISGKNLLGHKRHNDDNSSIKCQKDLFIEEMRKEFPADKNINKESMYYLRRELISSKEILIDELEGINPMNVYDKIPNHKNVKLTLEVFTVNELIKDSPLIKKLKNIFHDWVVQIDKSQNKLIIAGNFKQRRTGKNFKNLINSLKNFDLGNTHGVLKITIDAYCHEEEMFSKLFDNNLQHNFNDYFISTIFQKFERLEEKRKYFSESKNKAKFNLY